MAAAGDLDDQNAALALKSVGRGVFSTVPSVLETVQETVIPTTSEVEVECLKSEKYPDDEREETGDDDKKEPATKAGESGSDSGADKLAQKSRSQEPVAVKPTRPKTVNRSSFTSLAPSKARTSNETSTSKNMTVETETVSSIPHVPIATTIMSDRAMQGRSDAAASIRVKASNETIRPKKKTRKATSINSGTSSSRADLFEVRVSQEMNQADSSGSEDTFVYESSPLELPLRPSRHHSRTPSATSTASIAEHFRGTNRSIGNVMDSHRGVVGKRSIKFSSNPMNSMQDTEVIDEPDGTVRGSKARVNGGSNYHHHVGRHGRVSQRTTSRQSSRPSSPTRAYSKSNGIHVGSSSIKRNGELLSEYELEGEGAFNERTPLLNSLRSVRLARKGWFSRSECMKDSGDPLQEYERYQYCQQEGRQSPEQNHGRERRRGRRYVCWIAGCVFVLSILALLVCGAVGFLLVTTKPLYLLRIKPKDRNQR